GPAGLFSALYLARGGMCVTLVERGKNVEERAKDVESFFGGGTLNESCNVQFGEGGAGTFSDGKLNTQVNNPLISRVLGDFVNFGAPEEVEYLNKPHVGSDRLPKVVGNIRREIVRLGGEVRFNEKLEDIIVKDGRVTSCKLGGGGEFDEIVLAIGHSARDTFEMLLSRGVAMESKAFAVGFRIEHPQELISRAQYGKDFSLLPPADYKLVSHAHERSAFTFCMCPGGYVIPAASEEGGVVTNGMSNYDRSGSNANSAVVAQVFPEDFPRGGALSGVEFQRKLEAAAFSAGGKNYSAPACTVGDYVRKRGFSSLGTSVRPTYSRGVCPYPLHTLLPEGVADSIRLAITDMDRRLRGFADGGAILTGVESRTSSPVRILRGENFASVSAENLYPCGEGAGYAGGITSAAADGIRVAEAIISKYRLNV
ncbi:MAG: hypothetical protein J6126_03555, partial [Clostridia bacterium]|nr:hypothetical protein [Clostridia bacterium]